MSNTNKVSLDEDEGDPSGLVDTKPAAAAVVVAAPAPAVDAQPVAETPAAVVVAETPAVAGEAAAVVTETPAAEGAAAPAEDPVQAALARVGAQQVIEQREAAAAAGEAPGAEVVTTKADVLMPPNFEYRENVKDTVRGVAFEVQLYGTGCLECDKLVEGGTESYVDCHFSKGNQFCPAGYTRVVFVGQRMRLIQKLRKAQEKKDTNRVMQILHSMEDEPLEFKTAVLKEVGLLGAS